MKTHIKFMCFWRVSSLAALWLGSATASLALQENSKQDLGSSATWEEIRSGAVYKVNQNEPPLPKLDVFENPEILEVSAAGLSQPLLRDRLVLPPERLLPGNGAVFLMRAVQQLSTISPAVVQSRNAMELALEENQIPLPHELRARLDSYSRVFGELERFAQYRDLEWELNLSDLPLGEAFGQTLGEYQQIRELARLLRFRILLNLQEENFSAVMRDLRIGYRLVEFCRKNDLLIVQLIGNATEGIMRDCIEQAIRTPGFPNLYFALAEVSHDASHLRRAVESEMTALITRLPIFITVETEVWSESQASEYWTKALELIQATTSLDSNRNVKTQALMIGMVNLRGPIARAQLIKRGVPAERLDKLCPQQLVAWEAKLDIQQVADLTLAALLVPTHSSTKWSNQADELLDELKKQGLPSGYLGDLVLPAISRILESHHRGIAQHHKLMTIEAIRDYAHSSGGQLPKSLSDVTELPLPLNPFTGEKLLYSVSQVGNQQHAVLELPGYPQPDIGSVVTLSFRTQTDANR